MGPGPGQSLDELNLSVQIELKEIFWRPDLRKAAMTHWKTDLRELPRSFFVQCDDKMIQRVGFHETKIIRFWANVKSGTPVLQALLLWYDGSYQREKEWPENAGMIKA